MTETMTNDELWGGWQWCRTALQWWMMKTMTMTKNNDNDGNNNEWQWRTIIKMMVTMTIKISLWDSRYLVTNAHHRYVYEYWMLIKLNWMDKMKVGY